jgi:hypothetical protein
MWTQSFPHVEANHQPHPTKLKTLAPPQQKWTARHTVAKSTDSKKFTSQQLLIKFVLKVAYVFTIKL